MQMQVKPIKTLKTMVKQELIKKSKTLPYIENNSIANNLRNKPNLEYEPYISSIWEQIKECHCKDGQSLITKLKSRAIFCNEFHDRVEWTFLYGLTVAYDKKVKTMKEAIDLLAEIDWGVEGKDSLIIENSGIGQILVTVTLDI